MTASDCLITGFRTSAKNKIDRTPVQIMAALPLGQDSPNRSDCFRLPSLITAYIGQD